MLVLKLNPREWITLTDTRTGEEVAMVRLTPERISGVKIQLDIPDHIAAERSDRKAGPKGTPQ